jgi:hypothetical protein
MDGFTTEFYKFFWKDINLFLIRSFNHGYVKGLWPKDKELLLVFYLPFIKPTSSTCVSLIIVCKTFFNLCAILEEHIYNQHLIRK